MEPCPNLNISQEIEEGQTNSMPPVRSLWSKDGLQKQQKQNKAHIHIEAEEYSMTTWARKK